MNQFFRDLEGLFRVSRIPNLIVIFFTQVFTAYFLVPEFSGKESLFFSYQFALLLLSTNMIAAAGYIINDYYDQKIDLINRPEKVIVGIKFSRRLALISHTLLNLGAIGFGFLSHPFVGAIHIFSGFLLWYYSNHLRRIPFVGNIAIAFLTGLTFLVVGVYFNKINSLLMFYASFAFAITLIREIIKDIEAVKGDTTFGCVTIPVIWGIRGAKWMIYIICLVGLVILLNYLFFQSNTVLWIYFAVLTPFFSWFIYKIIVADTQKEYQLLHALSNAIILSGIISIVFN